MMEGAALEERAAGDGATKEGVRSRGGVGAERQGG